VTQILWSVLPDEQRLCGGVQFYFSQLTNLLVIANSSLNVVVYMTFNTRFRQVRSFQLSLNEVLRHGSHFYYRTKLDCFNGRVSSLIINMELYS